MGDYYIKSEDGYLKYPSKKLMFFDAIKDIVMLFIEQEIGTSCNEINYLEIARYINSGRFAIDTFDNNTKEDIYQMITDDILNGLPIWRFAILPEYKMSILEHAYDLQKEEERKKLERTYKCYTCEYYKSFQADLGFHESCEFIKMTTPTNSRREKHQFSLRRREDSIFKPKKRCKNYKKKAEE